MGLYEFWGWEFEVVILAKRGPRRFSRTIFELFLQLESMAIEG